MIRRLTIAGIVFSLVAITATLAQAQTIAACLDKVNAKRAAMGLYPIQMDMACQAQAERESIRRAQIGESGHLPNGCAPGSAEGVGMRGGADHYGQKFLTCFHSPGGGGGRGFFRRVFSGPDYTTKYHKGGAAVAVNARGESYYTFILKN